MSKVLKSSDFSNDSSRLTPHLIKTKRAGALLNPTPSSSKLMIGRQESPYSKFQSITKTRSSSNLKKSSQLKLKSISPNQYSTLSVLNTSESKRKKIEKKSSAKNSSLSKSFHETREQMTEKFADYQKDANLLEMKLNERLRGSQGIGARSKDLWHVYKEVFLEVVKKDKIFAEVLEKIRAFYEGFIKEIADFRKVGELEEKIKGLEMNLKSQIEKNKDFEKKYERLAKENYEIAKELDRSQEICTELQKRLCSISDFTLPAMPKDENKWKALVLENKHYSAVLKSQSEDLKSFKYKEKKLLQLVMALKQRGCPVEETYKEIMSISKPQLSPSSNSEAENLLSDRLNPSPKPANIPNLNISLLQPSSSYSDSPTSTY